MARIIAAADQKRRNADARGVKSTLRSGFRTGDKEKSGSLDEGKLRDGLNAALPRTPVRRCPGGPGRTEGQAGPGGRGGQSIGSWSTLGDRQADGRAELVGQLEIDVGTAEVGQTLLVEQRSGTRFIRSRLG